MRVQMKLLASVIAVAALASAAAARADTLFTLAGPTGEMATNASTSVTFNAGAGAGLASFAIDGFASLDGQNFYEDDFTLSLNGAAILSGTFNLGGGGDNVVFFAPVDASVNNISGNGTDVTFAGGQVLVTAPLSLLNGSNTLTFGYTSLAGPDHADFQGTGDEGWGLSNVRVSGFAAGVPEPATWGLMLTGFGIMGGLLRRQRAQTALVRA